MIVKICFIAPVIAARSSNCLSWMVNVCAKLSAEFIHWAMYDLSKANVWCEEIWSGPLDSNPQPSAWEANAHRGATPTQVETERSRLNCIERNRKRDILAS